jgi:putative glutamine amidotransferase
VSSRSPKVIIGLSPRILRKVPPEMGFRDKTLQYLEESMAHCVMRLGAVAVMIPTVERSSDIERWEVSGPAGRCRHRSHCLWGAAQ